MSNTREHDCYKCVFRGGVPGSRHSSCSGIFAAVRLNPHGVKNGWANHPMDFDPVWVEECLGFKSSDDPDATEAKERNDKILEVLHINPNDIFDLVRIRIHRRQIIESIAEAMKVVNEEANNADNNNTKSDSTGNTNTRAFSPYESR